MLIFSFSLLGIMDDLTIFLVKNKNLRGTEKRVFTPELLACSVLDLPTLEACGQTAGKQWHYNVGNVCSSCF